MPTIEISFTALPAHVRTARLVSAAVARRSGLADSLLDEVRIAVGEACSRAVRSHQQHCPGEPVTITMTASDGRFEVAVADAGAPGAGEAGGLASGDAPAGERALVAAVTRAGAVAGHADAGQGSPAGAGPDRAAGAAAAQDQAEADSVAGFSLAVIAGLVDDVRITGSRAGTTVRMSWPLDGPAAVP